MMFFWIFFLLGLFYCEQLRRARVRTKTLRCRYRLYALRDRLRERAIDGWIQPKNWVFKYLDSSITKTISRLDEITAWHAVFLYFEHRRDPAFQVAKEHLNRELTKAENRALRRIHTAYYLILANYLFERHSLSVRFAFSQVIAYLLFTEFLKEQYQRFKRVWRSAVEGFTEEPETSTLCEFSH